MTNNKAKFFLLCISITALISFFVSPSAHADSITSKMVEEKYSQLKDILNDRQNFEKAALFLHQHISEDASFQFTVSNPVVSKNDTSPVLTMNKEDYINSYLQGPSFVHDYSFDIEAKGFKYDQGKKEAFTLDVMTERGIMPSELNTGKQFISQTICRTKHQLNNDKLVATASECHTEISFEESI
jgi:hypothetical protein